jgi:hypothetical protein
LRIRDYDSGTDTNASTNASTNTNTCTGYNLDALRG